MTRGTDQASDNTNRAEVQQALTALARLLGRQAAREFVAVRSEGNQPTPGGANTEPTNHAD